MSNPYHTQVGGEHYMEYPVQLAEFLIRNEVPWAVGEVFAHVLRYREKHGVEDLRKAAHYIEMLMSLDGGRNAQATLKLTFCSKPPLTPTPSLKHQF